MESKHKNALIGGLLAVVFIMAIGFAGFTQQLTINEEAAVTSSWDISFDSASANVTCSGSDTSACGEVIGFTTGATEMTFNTKMFRPGETVTYTVTVKNSGNVAAKLQSLDKQVDNSGSLITYTINGLTEGTTTIPAKTGDTASTIQFTVVVAFPQTEGNIAAQDNGLTLTLGWVQA